MNCKHALMMNAYYLKILLIVLLIPVTAFAYTPQQVSEWTEQTIMTTISAGYHETVSEAANVHSQFKYEAWQSMEAFLQDHIDITRDPKITLHAKPIVSAQILAPDDCDEARCWWVHQAFIVPQLNYIINVTALVATADAAHSSPLIIQSLDIMVTPD